MTFITPLLHVPLQRDISHHADMGSNNKSLT